MIKTKKAENVQGNLAIDTDTLASWCGCGKATAVKIGKQAGARIEIGRRVLWNVAKIQVYLDSIATD